MRYRDGIGAILSKDYKIVPTGYYAIAGVIYDRLMRERFCHRAVADGKRLFPYRNARRRHPKPALLVHPNDITREVSIVIRAGIPRRHVHTMHHSHAQIGRAHV